MKPWKLRSVLLVFLGVWMALVPAFSCAANTSFLSDSFWCEYLGIFVRPFGGCVVLAPSEVPVHTSVATPATTTTRLVIVPHLSEPQVLGASTVANEPVSQSRAIDTRLVSTSAPHVDPTALAQVVALQQQVLWRYDVLSQLRFDSLARHLERQSARDSDQFGSGIQRLNSAISDMLNGTTDFNELSVNGSFRDGAGSGGAVGYVLQSSGAGVRWVATSTLGIASGGSSTGTVSSVALSAPAGFVVSGSPVTSSGVLSFGFASGYEALLSASSTSWNNFYTTPSARIAAGSGLGWIGNTLTLDTTGNWSGTFGGQTGAYYLDRVNHTGTQSTSTITGVFDVAHGGTGATSSAAARTNLGATTVGASLFTLGDPGATSFLRINADNSVSALDAGSFLAAIGAGAGSGTVSSVGLTAPAGFTVSGSPVTSAGTLALSYAAGYGPVLTASSTIWNNFYNTPSGRIGAGTGLVWSGNTLSINTAGDWTGTFDGLEGAAYLDRANHTGTQATSTIAGVFGTVHGGTGLSSIVQNQLLIGGAGNTWSQMATSSLGLSAAFTNSAELAALISDEVGTGNVVFSDSPSFTGNVGIGTSTPGASLTVAGNQITTGYLSVGSTAPVNTTAGDFTANRVFIGNATPLTTNVTPGFQVVGNSAATSQILSARFSNDVNPPGFQSAKARGTAASPSELLVGDSLYSLSGYGYVSSGVFAQGSTIIAAVDKTPTTTAIPTALLFATASSTIPLERMRISSNGNVGIGSSTPSASLAVVSSGSTVIPLILSVNGGTTFAQFYNAAGTLRAQIGDGSFSAGTGSLTNVAFGSLSDNNNGIYFPAADNTAIVTNGAERFRVDSSGNVGVGTSTPATKLDVNGSVQLEGTSSLLTINPYGAISDTNAISFTANRGNVGYDGAYSSLVLQSGVSKDIRFVTNNTGSLSGANPVMIIGGGNSAMAGYVGIGTTTPSYPLDVNGSVAFGASINSGNGSNVGDVNLELGSLRTASGNAYVDLHSTAGSDFDFRIIRSAGLNGNALLSNAGAGTFSLSANGVSRLTIDGASGNVGIGTTTPTTKLEVFASGEAMRIGDDTNANTYLGMAQITGNGPRAFFGYNATAYGSDSGYAVIQGGPSKGIGFSVGNGYTFGGAPSLYITGSSSVGIGTTSPSGKLTVASTSRSSYAVNMLDTDGSNSGGLYLSVSGAGVVLLNDDTGATKVQIHGNGSSVLNGGNLGIGTSSPAAKLDLYGTAGSADIFAISSSSNSRLLTVAANGNVGIGTTTPTPVTAGRLAFQIVSSAGIESLLNVNSVVSRWFNNGLSSGIGNQSASDFIVFTSGTTRLTVNGAGDVGIGTTTPAAKLDLYGTAGSADIFAISSSSNARLLTVAANGNVGIGSSSPAGMLSVVSASSSVVPLIVQSNNGTVFTQFYNAAGVLRMQINDSAFSAGTGSLNTTAFNSLSDYNNGIYFPAPDNTAIVTNGVERFRVNQVGNIGIGTTSPTALLDVVGTTTTSDLFAVSSSSGSRLLTVAANGNVGIGTISPTALFQVVGSLGNISVGNTGDVLTFTRAATNYITANNASGGLSFQTGGANDRLVINSSGNVSVGTTTAPDKLNVAGNIALMAANALIHTRNGDANTTLSFDFPEVVTATPAARFFRNTSTTATAIVQIFSGDGTSNIQTQLGARNNSFLNVLSGNVGIGTSTPSAKLDITGTAGAGDIFAMSSSSGARIMTVAASGNIGIGTLNPTLPFIVDAASGNIPASFITHTGTSKILLNNGTNNAYISNDSAKISFGFSSNDTLNSLFITASGNVGVGTINPTNKFEVAGNSYFGGNLTATGTLTISGVSTLATTTISNLTLTQVLAGTNGGTGLSTITPNQLLIGGAGNTWTQMATSALAINLADTTGTLSFSRLVNFGGTNNILYTSAANTLATSSAFTFDGATLSTPALTVAGITTLATTSLTGTLTLGTTAIFEANGNVGIGTTTPSAQFQLLANNNLTNTAIHLIQQSGSGDAATRYSLTGGNAFTIGVDNSDNDSFKMSYSSTSATGMGTGDYFTLTTAGNFGLGTTSPSAQLNVYASNTNTNTAMVSIQQAGSGDSSLRFNLVNGVAYTMGIDNTDSDSFKISYNATNGVSMGSGDYFTVTNGGNIGIGTTTPAQRLDVLGAAILVGGDHATWTARTPATDKSGYLLSPHYSSPTPVVFLRSFSNVNSNTISFGGGTTIGNSATALEFYTATNTTTTVGQVRMNINSVGNVGIGTTSPNSLLSVAGDGYFGGNLTATGTLTVSGAATLASTSISNLVLAQALTGASGGTGLSTITQNQLLIGGAGNTWVQMATSSLGLSAAFANSAQLAGLLSDETGTGNVVFSASPTLTGTTNIATTSMSGALMMGSQYIGNDGGVEGLSFDTSGRAKLLSTSGAVTAGLTISNGSAAVNSGASLEFETGGTLTQGRISTAIEGASSASNMAFYTRGSGVTSERMRISSNGNVGIGTTSSSSLLTVAGTLTVTGTSTFAGNVGIGTTTPAAQLSVVGAAGIDALAVSSSTANKKMFVIDSNGKVGIGTDSPSFDLEVVNSAANATFIIDSKNASDAVFRFREGGSSRFVLGNEGSSDSFRIATGTTLANGSNVALTVVMSGNVGIGTTTPTAQLTTAGSVRFANFGAGTLSTDADGNLSVSSDERLKDIQGNYTAGLPEILGINPILFKWNATSGLERNTVYAGFSAQNVKAFLPDAVGQDKRGFLTLSDRSILAAVVNAIHGLWDTVQGIDTRTTENAAAIDALKKENEALKARLDAIESKSQASAPATSPAPIAPAQPVGTTTSVVGETATSTPDTPVVPDTPPTSASAASEPAGVVPPSTTSTTSTP